MTPQPGQLIANQLRLQRQLGQGGMGDLYLAQQLDVDRPVAIKFVRDHLAQGAESLQRFHREARAMAQINHPHVVQIFSAGQTEWGSPYFVMEYVPGRTLASRLHEGPIPEPRALKIAHQVALGLAAAHRRGIVHRDLKPENIMLTETDGDPEFVKLVDFGIAQMVDESGQRLTREGFTCGTPEFMSPEQFSGGAVDARSDIYSLGVVLFEMLTGRPLFTGATPFELGQQHVMTPAPAPRTLRNVSSSVDALTVECLQKEPERRPASAAELALRLAEEMTLLGAHEHGGRGGRPAPLEAQAGPGSTEPFAMPVPPAQGPAQTPGPHPSRPTPPPSPASTTSAPSEVPSTSPYPSAVRTLRYWASMLAPTVFILLLVQLLNPAGRARLGGLLDDVVGIFQTTDPEPPTATGGGPAPTLPASGQGPTSSNRAAPTAEPPSGGALDAAIACLNRHAPRGYDSLARYSSWVDSTGEPRKPGRVLGLYPLYELEHPDCGPQAFAGGTVPNLSKQAQAFAHSLETLFPLSVEAHRYYANDRWKEDGFAGGRALHGNLMAAFEDFVASEEALRAVVKRRIAERDEWWFSLHASGGEPSRAYALHATRVALRELLELVNVPWQEMGRLKKAEVVTALTRAEEALTELGATGDFPDVVERGLELLVPVRALKRRLDRAPLLSQREKRSLASGLGVEGTPEAVIGSSRWYFMYLNSSEPMKAAEWIALKPRVAREAP